MLRVLPEQSTKIIKFELYSKLFNQLNFFQSNGSTQTILDCST